MSKAQQEYNRIKTLSAFNISAGRFSACRKIINQHASKYYFDDGSILQINATTSKAIIQNTPYKKDGVKIGALSINKQSTH